MKKWIIGNTVLEHDNTGRNSQTFDLMVYGLKPELEQKP
jgi:hypothetical protein